MSEFGYTKTLSYTMMTRSQTRIAQLENQVESMTKGMVDGMYQFYLKEKELQARIDKLEIDNKCLMRLMEVQDSDSDEDTDDGEYCDWCAAKIKPSDYDLSENGNIFHCMNNDCDKVVCGRRGCSQQLSYYVCCEECEDSAHSSTYEDESQLWRDFYKTTDKVCEGFTKKKQPCKNKVSSGKFCCLHC